MEIRIIFITKGMLHKNMRRSRNHLSVYDFVTQRSFFVLFCFFLLGDPDDHWESHKTHGLTRPSSQSPARMGISIIFFIFLYFFAFWQSEYTLVRVHRLILPFFSSFPLRARTNFPSIQKTPASFPCFFFFPFVLGSRVAGTMSSTAKLNSA